MITEPTELYYSVYDAEPFGAVVLDGGAQGDVWRAANESVEEIGELFSFNLGTEGWADGLALSELVEGETPPPWGYVGQYGMFGCVLNDAREGWMGDRAVGVTVYPYDADYRGLVTFLQELEATSHVRFRKSFVSVGAYASFAGNFIFDPGESEEARESQKDAIPSEDVIDAAIVWGRTHAVQLGASKAHPSTLPSDEDVRRFEEGRATDPFCYHCGGEGTDPDTNGMCRLCLGTGKTSVDPTEIDWTGQDLSGEDLSGLELLRARLTGANLEGADLSEADLTESDLSSANLSGVKADGGRFARAKLRSTVLTRATLENADLDEADLTETDLSHANLAGASLLAATLNRATLSAVNLSGAQLDGADLTGARPEDAASLDGASLIGATGLTKEQLSACVAGGAIVEFGPVQWMERIKGQRLGQTLRRIGRHVNDFLNGRREERDTCVTALRERLEAPSGDDRIALARALGELAWALDTERILGAFKEPVTVDAVDDLAERVLAWLDIRGFAVIPKKEVEETTAGGEGSNAEKTIRLLLTTKLPQWTGECSGSPPLSPVLASFSVQYHNMTVVCGNSPCCGGGK